MCFLCKKAAQTAQKTIQEPALHQDIGDAFKYCGKGGQNYFASDLASKWTMKLEKYTFLWVDLWYVKKNQLNQWKYGNL